MVEKKDPFFKYLNLVWSMISGVGVLTYAGYYIDSKFKTRWWTFVGVGLGMIYCGYLIWKMITETD
ncbi:MAG: AtpZ/AtpI family protein [Candidatus Omnitrophica bacterium]|nr:AtpZ/AtpI family protein [Candidatus Omnitrophota bacterium]